MARPGPESDPLRCYVAKVAFAGDDECWLWTAQVDKNGYGRFAVARGDGRQIHIRAHRYAYAMAYGDLPEGMCVCHSCDNPPCVNPAHLWLGSSKQNNDDKMSKGRQAHFHPFKTHCKRGHPYSGDNLYIAPNGQRTCRRCAAIRAMQRYVPRQRAKHYRRSSPQTP